MPLVSIVVPYFNRLQHLPQLAATLGAQTLSDWEVLIIDDASEQDPTAVVAGLFPEGKARVIRMERNGGPAAARNRGIAEARGRFIAFLDSDDVWVATKLEAQVAAALATPSPDRVFCYCRTVAIRSDVDRSELPARGLPATEAPTDYLFLNGGFAQTSSMLVGRAAAQAFGFDPALRQYEDYLYFIDARDHVSAYVFVDAALSVWNDEPRPDRLSRGASKSIANADLFIGKLGARLSSKARIRFLVTHLGKEILHLQPMRGFGLFTAAVLLRAVSPRYALFKIFRS